MAEYVVTPLHVGDLHFYRGSFTSKQEQFKERELFPILSFLIEGNGRRILVDTGGGDPTVEPMLSAGHAPSLRPEEQRVDNVLRAKGIDPASIDMVVLSHLHWDHCYNNEFFPEATFHVQKSEMLEAVAPLPKFQGVYESFSGSQVPPWARQVTRWKLVEGEYELCDGVTLVPLPGHSAGLQGVLVDTADGKLLLASDAVPTYENIEGLADGVYHISTLCSDLAAFYRTFDLMRELQAEGVDIVASHDYLTLDKLAR